jgi:hypothetical protein
VPPTSPPVLPWLRRIRQAKSYLAAETKRVSKLNQSQNLRLSLTLLAGASVIATGGKLDACVQFASLLHSHASERMDASMKTRANITVDPVLWKQFRLTCFQHDTSASAEFEAFMKMRLQQWEQKGGEKQKK